MTKTLAKYLSALLLILSTVVPAAAANNVGSLQPFNNLADVDSLPAARSNISVGPYEPSIAAMAALSGTQEPTAWLSLGLRSGQFQAVSGNLAALHTADPDEGEFIPYSTDPTGASGGYQRVGWQKGVQLEDWGAVGNDTTIDDQSMVDYIGLEAYQTVPLYLRASSYLFDEEFTPNNVAMEVYGAGATSVLDWSASSSGVGINGTITNNAYLPWIVENFRMVAKAQFLSGAALALDATNVIYNSDIRWRWIDTNISINDPTNAGVGFGFGIKLTGVNNILSTGVVVATPTVGITPIAGTVGYSLITPVTGGAQNNNAYFYSPTFIGNDTGVLTTDYEGLYITGHDFINDNNCFVGQTPTRPGISGPIIIGGYFACFKNAVTVTGLTQTNFSHNLVYQRQQSPANEDGFESTNGGFEEITGNVFRNLGVTHTMNGVVLNNTPAAHVGSNTYVNLVTGASAITLGTTTDGSTIDPQIYYGAFTTITDNSGETHNTYSSGLGTSTPTLSFATAGDSTWSYAGQLFNWTRTYNNVWMSGVIIGTPTYTTASGNLQINLVGMPLPSDSNTSCLVEAQNAFTWGTGDTQITGLLSTAGVLSIVGSGSTKAASVFGTSQFASGTQISFRVACNYHTNAF